MTKTTVSIIIPAFNEAQTIGDVVGKIKSLYPDFEIIVIDDGSTDDTGEVAKDAGAIVYSHPYNIGNGAAIKSGIRIASGEILVFMDGDGQHEPRDIQKLIEHFPGYDMVVGARKAEHQASWGRALGNRIYNWLASYVSKFPVQDLTSGFRAIKSEIAHNLLYLLPNTYSYPTTLTLGVLRSGRNLRYTPIIVPLAVGTEFFPAIKIFRLLLPIIIGMSLAQLMTSQWIGRGVFLTTTLATTLSAAVHILANAILIPKYGMEGAVWSALFSYVVLAVLVQACFAFWCEKKYKESLRLKNV